MSKQLLLLLERCDSIIRELAYGDNLVSPKRFKTATDLLADIRLIKKQIEEITSNEPYNSTLPRAESGEEICDRDGVDHVKKP